MARRLTGFSKFLITLLILGMLFFAGKYVLNNTAFGKNLQEQAAEAAQEQGTSTSNQGGDEADSGTAAAATPNIGRVDEDGKPVLRVQLVTWGGYGPGLYWNEGAKANIQSRFYKDYGFKVDFRVENDLINAMNAWVADEYDVLVQTADAFPLYTAPAEINEFEPTAFMQVDWSRGGDAIIAKRGIKSINDLKGMKIAVAVPSPAQTLLISALEAAGMKYSDVKVIKTSDNLKAAELFRSDDIDAAVVWSPDDIFATRDVPGSTILLTTKEQSHIIADIMFAKKSFIDNNKRMIDGFYEGWMKAVAELKAAPSNVNKAAKYLAELNGMGIEDGLGMCSTVYWTGHGDNMNFFGLNSAYKGQKGRDLYTKMGKKFVETGDSPNAAPSWRSVVYTGAAINANTRLTAPKYRAEKSKEFKPATPTQRKAAPFAVKPVTINFPSGVASLSENAKTIIDLQFADVAKSFANTRVRIEGNTDSDGGRTLNLKLSEARAKSVASYLKAEYGIQSNRIIIKGNGPDNPVTGCEKNQNADCKAKNRRTEFQLIAE